MNALTNMKYSNPRGLVSIHRVNSAARREKEKNASDDDPPLTPSAKTHLIKPLSLALLAPIPTPKFIGHLINLRERYSKFNVQSRWPPHRRRSSSASLRPKSQTKNTTETKTKKKEWKKQKPQCVRCVDPTPFIRIMIDQFTFDGVTYHFTRIYWTANVYVCCSHASPDTESEPDGAAVSNTSNTKRLGARRRSIQ